MKTFKLIIIFAVLVGLIVLIIHFPYIMSNSNDESFEELTAVKPLLPDAPVSQSIPDSMSAAFLPPDAADNYKKETQNDKRKMLTEIPLVDAFNTGKLYLCLTCCRKNSEFSKYKDDIEYILGFWKNNKDNPDCELLKKAGWYNASNKPTKDHFNINSLEEIHDKADEIRNIVYSDF